LESAVKLPSDPTVKGARFVPLDVRGAVEYGTEADGAVRALLHGYRITETPDGGVRVSSSRLDDANVTPLPLPERMGGGALFASSSKNTVFRSTYWLGDAEPIYIAGAPITGLFVGLDRVYVRTGNGAYTAMNPRTGDRTDMGPWPKAPMIGGALARGFVAADAWRAAAIADFYGVLLTTDAGTTWKGVNVPVDPKELRVVDGKIFVADNKRPQSWFEIRNDRTAVKAPAEPVAPKPAFKETTPERTPFGASPLEAVATEGWPLGDGTAVVARDGQLGRVRLDGGMIVDLERHAFPMNPARCKAIALGNTADHGDFGFVCAEPEGKTALYGFDAARGALAPVREWKRPRVVLASGNGAVAVRGGCDPEAALDKTNAHRYCVMAPAGTTVLAAQWHDVEVKFQGEAGNEHVVVLADGRVAIVTPPSIEGTGARLTIVAGRDAKTVPLTFPTVSTDVARILKVGAWLDGMEEIAPRTIAGWIEAGGVMLGVRVSLDGQVEIGQYVRDAGTPMVSGRYGFGWTTGKRGFETMDGGMTWTAVEIPDHDSARATMRGCGPVGCTGPGWLRIGWGVPKETPVTSKPSTAPPSPYGSRRMSDLRCEALAPPPPTPVEKSANAPKQNSVSSRYPTMSSPFSSYSYSYGYGSATWSSFYAFSAPTLRSDERGLSQESLETLDSTRGLGSFARAYVWGPRTGDLDTSNAHFFMRWLTPFGGWQDAKATRAISAPQDTLDWWKPGGLPKHAFVAGDDDDHALLVTRRGYGTSVATLTALEADHSPIEIHRADGEPFVELDSAMHALGHWYLAIPTPVSEKAETIIFRVDGAVAHELARVRRAGYESRAPNTRLARRADGHTIGLAVDGQFAPDGRVAIRWVMPVDVETGSTGEPEPLGAHDLSDRGTVGPCRAFDDGWIVDVPWSASPRFRVGDGEAFNLGVQMVRARVSREHACIEAASGNLSSIGEEAKQLFSRRGNAKSDRGKDAMRVSVLADRMRFALACTVDGGPAPPRSKPVPFRETVDFGF
jgi:hypothetical protein